MFWSDAEHVRLQKGEPKEEEDLCIDRDFTVYGIKKIASRPYISTHSPAHFPAHSLFESSDLPTHLEEMVHRPSPLRRIYTPQRLGRMNIMGLQQPRLSNLTSTRLLTENM
jgi:hypothetical protein